MASTVQPLSVQQLRDWLAQAGPAPLILDVREPWETATCSINGSVFIPMGQIPNRIEELPQDRDIVVLCHHGARSLEVAYFLNARGFRSLYNLNGGIDAWAREVDPNVPTY